ncbi:serine phosphatase RsbU (regulator of sigma subunit) [Streptomyces sp. KhCrAH-43]|uniref:PP2C family protein-serine/threonine phosphatase n=1 Tax=unclassified Streptomyces TaxID=2593676 RepID=UPI000377B596|nr:MULTISPECIES: PP2C family protein-serine/threonine phosphatase [unclassified Streptomyces]MYS37448.1 SpoIIE family protein phosphatase [Streptomyces sp. SID4920]MYX67989.1 SpoIIE family protein phosphatase [Streptomyces sp. SID8373]RAJ56840.1 serine phosphatase RsbU (regulator of sigma subunit) [Streptomyces sp. KhCrAH-43]
MNNSPTSDGERLLHGFMAEVHATAPTDIPALVNRYAGLLGLRRVEIYIVDLQQQCLSPLSGEAQLRVDASLAGSAFRSLALRVETTDTEALIAWLPLVDGVERLGVIGVQADTLDRTALERCRSLASVLAMAITSKRAFSDRFVQRARTETMTLPAEMVRALLPPRAVGEERALSTAVLEPAYELGGDAFDHSLTESTLHAVILDAMGHNLASGMTSALAMAGCRSSRRKGSGLRELVKTVDDVLAEWLPDQFCTGIVAQLDMSSGILSWINCGHPPPLLIRNNRVLDNALARPSEPPMGTPGMICEAERVLHEVSLRPGDRVLLYTDGVTEARLADGSQFGLNRFTTSVIRATAAGEPASEALRQLIHNIREYQHDRLSDDATIMMLEWRPSPPAV